MVFVSLLQDEGKSREAIDAYRQAIVYQIKMDDLLQHAQSLNNVALSYEKLEKYETALESYQQALELKQKVATQDS